MRFPVDGANIMPRTKNFCYRRSFIAPNSFGRKTRKRRMITNCSRSAVFAGVLSCITVGLMLAPAAAVEQCRGIQAKAEREACYQRQETELAEKRKPQEPRRDAMMRSLEQMKQEDAVLDRQIHSICRGC